MHINSNTWWRVEAMHYNERFNEWLSLVAYVQAPTIDEGLRIGRLKLAEQYPRLTWDIVSVTCKRPFVNMNKGE
jgi:hypothetical protein